MSEIINAESTVSMAKRGGARRGAGRPKSTQYLRARGIEPLRAAEVIAWHGERRGWHRLLNSEDDRVFLNAWLHLVNSRDGKPTQKLQITSLNVDVSQSQVESALAIARELQRNTKRVMEANTADITPKLSHSGTMLPAIEGQERVVDERGEG